MKVMLCKEEQIQKVATLFNQYRMFYEQEDNLDECYKFIKNNFINSISEIFVLTNDDDELVGFTQLYPSFCSVEMQPIRYLYDLFVEKSQRGKGYSKILMQQVIDHYRKSTVKRLTLDTAFTNKVAQSLYESIGYKRETDFILYHYRY